MIRLIEQDSNDPIDPIDPNGSHWGQCDLPPSTVPVGEDG